MFVGGKVGCDGFVSGKFAFGLRIEVLAVELRLGPGKFVVPSTSLAIFREVSIKPGSACGEWFGSSACRLFHLADDSVLEIRETNQRSVVAPAPRSRLPQATIDEILAR
jgi:hypothetical protein